MYASGGEDEISGGDEVWGGPGNDTIEGITLFGGRGDDSLARLPELGRQHPEERLPRRHWERHFSGTAWQYGGPGNDHLKGYWLQTSQMLVGGPGRDVVELLGHEASGENPRSNVVRIRDGGQDLVRCGDPVHDFVVYLDRVDRVGKRCRGAYLVYRGRPMGP